MIRSVQHIAPYNMKKQVHLNLISPWIQTTLSYLPLLELSYTDATRLSSNYMVNDARVFSMT